MTAEHKLRDMIHRSDCNPPCRVEYVDNMPAIVLYERQPIGDYKQVELRFVCNQVKMTERKSEVA